MDVVIPLVKNSATANLELRYCLRSIHRYVDDVENVFIIGARPSFLQNVIHIPAADANSRQWAAMNIFKKIVTACLDKRVSDNFYFFSDDHFLTRQFDPQFYYCGMLSGAINKMKMKESYARTLMNTEVVLKGGKNFNVHCPIVYNKELFMKTVNLLRWNLPYGFAIKSIYCNLNRLPGYYIPDLKIRMSLKKEEISKLVGSRPFFSTSDTAINTGMRDYLQELYPQNSPYES